MSASVKRRFIRQNREIARVNSTQSLRIRNLEAEISRLLAENISLREQAINSAQEAERWRSSHKVITEVGHLKDRLESRLSEVSALVTELAVLAGEGCTSLILQKAIGHPRAGQVARSEGLEESTDHRRSYREARGSFKKDDYHQSTKTSTIHAGH